MIDATRTRRESTLAAPWAAAVRALVGTPYAFGSIDPAVGLDCMTCAALVYRLIGKAVADTEGWVFPLPVKYGPDGRIELAHLVEYYRHWEPASRELGALVLLGDAHVGVQIDAAPWGDVIHCRPRTGVVISRHGRLRHQVTGYYRLRRGELDSGELPARLRSLYAEVPW